MIHNGHHYGHDGLCRRFFTLANQDFPQCDMLVVMGTSLVVHPFAGLISEFVSHLILL